MRNYIILFILLLTPLLRAAEPATQRLHNVLLLIGDDHGLDGACFGNATVDTPNLDRFARAGTRFANAFATVNSCSPSRAVILSGLYTHSNGQYGLAHAEHNQHTLAWVQTLEVCSL